MKLTCKKTSRLVVKMAEFLISKKVKCNLIRKYDPAKKREVFSIGREFMTAEKMVDEMIKICTILKIDLITSGIKCSRGYDIFI